MIRSDGSEIRDLVPEARTYFENRAVVWRNTEELIFIDEDGRTQLLEVETGTRRLLVSKPDQIHGWLVNSTLTHATKGLPTFGEFKVDSTSVSERDVLGGCQPYFSQDGRWGFWIAGAGGPVDRIDLATRRRDTVLHKNDRRLPRDRGYLYFPMLSDDGGLLAVAGSSGEHSHFQADYDVLVLPTDARTFEVTGPAVRFTTDPGPDRFPDVWRAPMPLGRHWGEAPYTVNLTPGAAGSWEWSFGEETTATGRSGSHTYRVPGTYRVEARQGERVARGLVTVAQAAPPLLDGVQLRDGGRRVEMHFDEPVSIATAAARLASSDGMASLELGTQGRTVIAVLDRAIEAEDRLILEGLSDRAQQPNVLDRLQIPLEPPGWPAATERLVFLWETADAPNAVFDAAAGADLTFALERMGGALLDRDYAMVVDRGTFAATEETGRRVSHALQSANEFSLEATVTSRVLDAGSVGLPIVSLGRGRKANLQLVQRGDRLALGVMSGGEYTLEPLMTVLPGVMTHVAVTYKPGRLVAYKDGVEVLSTDRIQSDFFHWDPERLAFGQSEDGHDWAGTIQGVAIYARTLDGSEVAENHDRFRRKAGARRKVESLALEARLVRASAVPSLEEISPYREALSVNEYEVLSVSEGDYSGASIRVAQWTVLGGRTLPGGRPGDVVSLRVEGLTDNPQLESVFVSDTLGPGEHQIFYASNPGLIGGTGRQPH